MKKALLSVAALAVVASAFPITFVSTRAGIGANDKIDWADLGVAFATVTNPTSDQTVGGRDYTVSHSAAGDLERRDQNTGWSGNFGSGEKLLWTRDMSGKLKIEFASLVKAVGTQIQADRFGEFRGLIEAYDAYGDLLGNYAVGGSSNSANDDSAVFLGVEHAAGIKSIVLGIGTNSDFAIDEVSINADVVPEPATLSVLGLGALALIRRRAR